MARCAQHALLHHAPAATARWRAVAVIAWIVPLACGVVQAEELVGDLGAAERLVVRGLEGIPPESLRAGLLGDAAVYWLGLPTAVREAYLAALHRRATLALEAAGFAEPRVRVTVEPRADGVDMVALDVVEGPRFMAGPIEVTGMPGDLAARLVRYLQESHPPPDALSIPDDPAAAATQRRGPLVEALHACGPDVLRWLEARLGRDAWPVAVARVVVLHGCGDEAAFDRELERFVAIGVADASADSIARLLGDDEDFVVRLRVFLARRAARRQIVAGRTAAAVAIYRDSLARLEKTVGPDAPAVMPLRIDCGLALVGMGDAKAALPILTTVVKQGESAGVDPVRITGLQFFLVLLLVTEKQFAEAIACAEAFLARVEAGHADEASRRDVPGMRESIGYCHGQLGDHEQSLAVYRTLLAEAEERHGPQHPETTKLLLNTIWLLNQTGDVAEAYRLNRRPRVAIERRSVVGLEPPMPASRKQPAVPGDGKKAEKPKADASDSGSARFFPPR